MAKYRFYIKVPFLEKDDAKEKGAKWDRYKKLWYYTNAADADKFKEWPAVEVEQKKVELSEEMREFIASISKKSGQNSKNEIKLSEEQNELIEYAKQGKNVLVDACIGSGKTTTIQVLCNQLPDKRILYLTYNKLLKEDAREKIKNRNVKVTNYHGFAFDVLKKAGVFPGVSDLIQEFLHKKDALTIPKFDLLVIDEYQDIEQELAEMLNIIKENNPGIQVIAVGDMAQKIYDKTTLDVPSYVEELLGSGYVIVNFTRCFRLSDKIAGKLGYIWKKKIVGVNQNCVEVEMTPDEAVTFLSEQNVKDILCLGSRNGKMAYVLNELENRYPNKFNKETVYASIKDEDRGEVAANKDVAIFTTYDSSKGLERRYCVVFDFTESYWEMRLSKSNTRYNILRNIFCVAASRGKEMIVYVRNSDSEPLIDKEVLAMPVKDNDKYGEPFVVSEMYSFKYKEDVEECYSMLDIEEIENEDGNVFDISSKDALIDLSPCIGILQEAKFFNNYDIDDEIEFQITTKKEMPKISIPDNMTLEEKVLLLTALETSYARYIYQVAKPFVSEADLKNITDRLGTVFSPDEEVQKQYEFVLECKKKDNKKDAVEIKIVGRDDVEKDGIIYELKFVSELDHEHFLQCAMYTVLKDCEYGILWNIKNNKMYRIKVKDKKKFLACTVKTITKGTIDSFVLKSRKNKTEDKDES